MIQKRNPIKALAVILSVVMLLSVVISPIDKVGAAAAKVSLSKTKLNLTVTKNGTKKTYGSQKLTVKKASGVQVKKTVFSSSAPKVAGVTSAGKVTAKAKGSAVITAKVTYKLKKKTKTQKLTCKVSVTEKDVTPVNITLNKTKTSIAVTRDGNTVNKGTVTLKVNASSGVKVNKVTYASDSAAATVNSKGVVTAQKRGSANITATVSYTRNGKAGTKKLTCKVTVDQKYKNMIKDLKVSQGVFCTFLGSSEGCKPYYQLKDGVKVDEDFYLWDCIEGSIADTSVAVLGTDGLIVGKKAGNTTITLKTTDGTDISTTAAVKVYNSREDVPAADDLYNHARSLYLPGVEAGWTQEDRERYIDEDNNVNWMIATVMDNKYNDNKADLIEKCRKKGKDGGTTDNTAEDAVASILSTSEQMNTRSGEEDYYKVIKDEVVTPIQNAGTTSDLMDVCNDLGKKGIVTMVTTNQTYGTDIQNVEVYGAVIQEKSQEPPEEAVDVSRIKVPMVSAEKLIDHRYLPEDQYPEDKKEEALKNYIKTMFSYVGITEQSMIDETLQLALAIENAQPSDLDETSLTKLASDYPQLKLKECVEGYGYDNQTDTSPIHIENASLIDVIAGYAKSERIKALKGYAILRALHDFGIYSKNGIAADYELMTAGTMEAKKDAEVEALFSSGMDELLNKMPWDFDQVYTDNVYDADYKAEVDDICDRYKAEYRKTVAASWMGSKAKTNMIAKVDKMRFYGAYPTHAQYDVLQVQDDMKSAKDGGRFGENVILLKTYKNHLLKLYIGHENLDTDWLYSDGGDVFSANSGPWLNNAFYDGASNAAYMPHMGLSELIASNPTDDEGIDIKNIAMMATTIGHEVGHGFDSTGSKYNANGEVQNVWDDQDKAIFKKKADKLTDIYDKTLMYGDLENMKAYYQPGPQLIDEALADLGGTEIALNIIKDTYGSKKTAAEMKEIKKQFFIYTAYQWLRTELDHQTEEQLQRNLANVHPMARQRANYVASMMNDFYEACDVKATDAMYFAPEDRVELWSVN